LHTSLDAWYALQVVLAASAVAGLARLVLYASAIVVRRGQAARAQVHS
jgi:hypothetical protein